MVFSNLPSYAPQILISLSAAKKKTTMKFISLKYTSKCDKPSNLHELASHSPFGLNFTEDTAFVCPASVNFNA